MRKQSSHAANTMKLGTPLTLPKPYISIKFGTIPGNIDENMTDSRYFYQFVDTPTGKTVYAIALKFLLGTNVTLKVDRFEGFVNQSDITDFMINKTSRCNFRRKIKDTLISALNNKPYNLLTRIFIRHLSNSGGY